MTALSVIPAVYVHTDVNSRVNMYSPPERVLWSCCVKQVVRVCRDHGLYSALIYLFTKGLDDYKSPLEELLAVSQQSVDPQQARGFGYVLLARAMGKYLVL